MRQDDVVRRAIQVGMGGPVLLVGLGIVIQLMSLDGLSAEVVTHWGPSGPDGYGPAWTWPVLTLLVGLGLPALLMASALPSLRRGERSPMLRLLPALAVGLSALIAIVSTGSVVIQRDDASAQSVVPVMILAFAGAILGGVLAWFAQPAQDAIVPASRPVAPLEASSGTRLVWLGRAEMGRGPMLALVAACALLVGLAVWMWVLGDLAAAIIVTAVAVLVTVLTSIMTVFHVRADARGLSVRSTVGFLRFTVPASDIASATVSDVSGLTQFGGWGVRSIPGATGIILRNGPALEVTRRSGRRLVVTLDDAETVAGVLAAAAGSGAHADQD
ncbi:DUF1648 domain-containing protein [Demequina sp. NBRC 110054]|uniref:DUF1648 domain-containing protein n=1 Tax=Demequina sp. NBRC 110054 TaxID=1570343 RepID=UPI001177B757|nr:DUF1648 domain-containing protein [Demequina sp. NBRC 110054]